jgi:hypothetical protein
MPAQQSSEEAMAELSTPFPFVSQRSVSGEESWRDSGAPESWSCSPGRSPNLDSTLGISAGLCWRGSESATEAVAPLLSTDHSVQHRDSDTLRALHSSAAALHVPVDSWRDECEAGGLMGRHRAPSGADESQQVSVDFQVDHRADARRIDALQRLVATQALAIDALRADRAALEDALENTQRAFRSESVAREAAEASTLAFRHALEEERGRLAAARRAYAQLLSGVDGAAGLATRHESAHRHMSDFNAGLATDAAAAAEHELGVRLDAQRRAAARAEQQLAAARGAQRRREQAGGSRIGGALSYSAEALAAVELRRRELEGVSGELVALCERLFASSLAVAAAERHEPPPPTGGDPCQLQQHWPAPPGPMGRRPASGMDEGEGTLNWPHPPGRSEGGITGHSARSPGGTRPVAPRKASPVKPSPRWASASANGTKLRRRGRMTNEEA